MRSRRLIGTWFVVCLTLNFGTGKAQPLSGTPLETVTAQRDTASAAWAVAQRRVDILEAQMEREAVQDSVHIHNLNTYWQLRMDDQKRVIRNMGLVAVGVATFSVLLFYVGTSAD